LTLDQFSGRSTGCQSNEIKSKFISSDISRLHTGGGKTVYERANKAQNSK